ncbi:MAG: nucleotidyltransferase domain-containing protein [Desulfohalobiaceae bacterium]|nr:nucleotidyltransferase domain-containing protein [Desulfohalobiaceae bacterium]
MSLITNITDKVLECLPELQAAYLFGSYANNDAHPGSDVDIAVLLPPAFARQMQSITLFQARCDLEKAVHNNVDLINLRRVNTILQKEVITYGKRFLCHDVYAAEEFEMLVFSAYQKLSQERSAIIESILQNGRVLAT